MQHQTALSLQLKWILLLDNKNTAGGLRLYSLLSLFQQQVLHSVSNLHLLLSTLQV